MIDKTLHRKLKAQREPYGHHNIRIN